MEMDSSENTSTIFYDGTYSAELSTYIIDSVSAAGQIVVSTDSNHFAGILPPTQTIDTATQLMLVYNNDSTATTITDSFEWIPTQAGQIRFSKGWQILTSTQNCNFQYIDPPATTNTISYLVYKQGGVGIGWTDVVNEFPFIVDTKCQLLSYDAVKNEPTTTTGTMTNHVLQTTNSNTTGLTFGYITPSNMNINPLDIAQGYSLLTINPDNTFGLSKNFGYSQEIEPGQIAYLEDNNGQYLLSGIDAPSASDLLLVTYLNDENKIRWQYMSFSSVSGIATPSLPDMLLVTSNVGSTTIWTYQSFSTASGIPDPDTASGFLVASDDAWVITPTSTATGIDSPSIQGNLLLANAATSRWESVSPSTATGIPDPTIPRNLLMVSSDNTWISVDRNTATGLPTTSVSGQIIVSDGSNGWNISDVAAVTGVPFPEKDGTLLTAENGKWSETAVSTAINIDDPTTTGYLLRAQNGRWRSTPVSDATLVASPVNNVGNLLVSNGATWIAQNILQATRVSYPENGRILQGYVQDGKSIWATRDVSSVTYVNFPTKADTVLISTYLTSENRYQWTEHTKADVLSPFLDLNPADDQVLVGNDGRWVSSGINDITGLPPPNEDDQLEVLVSLNGEWSLSNMNEVTNIPLHPSAQYQLLGSNATTSSWQIMDVADAINLEYTIQDRRALMSSDGGWIAVERSILTGVPEADVEDNIMYVSNDGRWITGPSYLVTGLSLPVNINTIPVATNGSWKETVLDTALMSYIDKAITNNNKLLQADGSMWKATVVSSAISIADAVDGYILFGSLEEESGSNTTATGKLTWKAYNPSIVTGIPKPLSDKSILQSNGVSWQETVVSTAISIDDSVLPGTILQANNNRWKATAVNTALSSYISLASASDGMLLQSDGSTWKATAVNTALSDYITVADVSNKAYFLKSAEINGSYSWQAQPFSTATGIPDPDSTQLFILATDTTNGGWCLMNPYATTGLPDPKPGHLMIGVAADGSNPKDHWVTSAVSDITGITWPSQKASILQSNGVSWQETVVSTAISIDDSVLPGTILQANNNRWKATAVNTALSDYITVASVSNEAYFLKSARMNGSYSWQAQPFSTATGIPDPAADENGQPLVLTATADNRWELMNPMSASGLPTDPPNPYQILAANADGEWTATDVNMALSWYITVAGVSNESTILQANGSTWKATAVNTALSDYITVAGVSNEAYFLKSARMNGSYSWQAQPFSMATGIPDPTKNNFVLGVENNSWALINPTSASGLPTSTPEKDQMLVASDVPGSDGKYSWSATVISTAISIDDSVLPGTILQANNNRWKATAVNTALSSYITVADVSNEGTLLQSEGSTWKATAVNTALSDYITVAGVSNKAYFLKSAEINGSYSWQAQPFSTATGIPDPTISNMVLASTGSGWMLTDPTSASGLPTSTPEKDQILVSSKKPNEDAYVWTNMNISSAISIDTAVTSTTGMLLQSNGTTWNATSISTAIRIPDATMSDQNMILVSNNNIHGNSTVTSWTKKDIASAISIAYAITNNDLLVAKNGSWVSKSVPEATGLPELDNAALAGQILSVDDTGMSWVLADLKASSGLPSGNVDRNKIMASGSSTGWSILDPNMALSSYISVASNSTGMLLQSDGSMWKSTTVNTALSPYISLASANNGYILQSNGTNWTAKEVSTVTGIPTTPESDNTFLVSNGGRWTESAVTATLLSPVIDPPRANTLLAPNAATTKWVAKSIAEATGLPELNNTVTPGYVIAVNQSKDGWILVNMNESTGMPSTPPGENQLMVGVLDSSGSTAIWGIRNQPDALSSYISVASNSTGMLLQSDGSMWKATTVNTALASYIPLASANNGLILQSDGDNWVAKEVSTVTGVPTTPESDNNTILVSNDGKWTESAVTATLLSPVIDPPTTDDTLLVSDATTTKWVAKSIAEATGLPELNNTVTPGYVIAVNQSKDGWILVNMNESTGMPSTPPGENQLMVGVLDSSGSTAIWGIRNQPDALSSYISVASNSTGMLLQSDGSMWKATTVNTALASYIPLASANNGLILQSDGSMWKAMEVSTVTGVPTTPESDNNTILVSNGGRWIESAVTATLLSPVIDPPRANTLLAPNAATTKWEAKTIAEATGLPELNNTVTPGYVIAVNQSKNGWILVNMNESTGMPSTAPGENQLMVGVLDSSGSAIWGIRNQPDALSSYISVANANNGKILQSNGTIWNAMDVNMVLSPYISLANANNGKILQSNGTNWTAKEVSTVTGIPVSPESDNNTILVSNDGKWVESAVTATLLSPVIDPPTTDDTLLVSNTIDSRWEAMDVFTATGLPNYSIDPKNAGKVIAVNGDNDGWTLIDLNATTGMPTTLPTPGQLMVGRSSPEGTNYWSVENPTTALSPYIANASTIDSGCVLVSDGTNWSAMEINEALTPYISLANGTNNGYILQSDGGSWVAKDVSTVTGIPTIPESDNNTILVSNDGEWTESAVTATLLSPVIDPPRANTLLAPNATTTKWVAKSVAEATGLPDITSSGDQNGKVLGVQGDTWTLVDLNDSTGIPAGNPGTNMIMASGNSTSWQALNIPTALSSYISVANGTNNGKILQSDGSTWKAMEVSTVTGVPTTPESDDNNTILVSNDGKWTESAVTAALLSPVIEIPTDSNMVLLSTTNSSWTAVESLNWTIVGLPEGSAEDANKILRYEIIDGQPRWSLVSITDSSGLPANAPNVNDILIGQQDNESVTWQLQQLNTALTYYIDAPPDDNDNSTRSILVSDNSRWTSMVISTAIGIPDPTSTNEMIVSVYTDGKYVWSKSNTATALSPYISLANGTNNGKILQSDGDNWVAKTVSTVTGIPTTPESDDNTILVSNDGTWTESAVTATLLSPVIEIPTDSNMVLLSTANSSWTAVESLPASITGLPAVSSTDQGCVLTVSTEGKWSVVDPSTSGSTGFLPTPSTNDKSILVATNKSWTITSDIASVTGVPTTPESDDNTILVSDDGKWTESAVTATLLSPVIGIPTKSNMVLLSTTNSSWITVESLPSSVTGLPTPKNSDILVSNGGSWVTSSVSTVTGIPTTPESDNNTLLVSDEGRWTESAVTAALLSPVIDPPQANTLLAPNAATTKWEATDVFTATGLPNYSIDPKNAGKVIAVNGDNDGWTLIDLNATTGMPTVAPEVGQLMVGRSSPEGTNYWNVENPSLALSPYIANASTVTGQILISNGTNWIALPSTDTNSLLIGNNSGNWTTGFIEDILPGTNNQLLQFNDNHWEAVTSIDWTIVGLPEGTSSDYSKFLQYTATGWELVAVNDETGIPSTPPEVYQLMASGNSTSWKNLDIKDALTPYIPLASANNGLILQSNGTNWVAKDISTVTGIAPPTTTNQILVSSNGSNWSPGMITASLLSNVIDIPSENKVLLGTKDRWTAVTSLSSSITGLPIATDSDQVIVSTGAGNWNIKNVNELVTPIAAPTASSRLLFSVNGTPDYQWQETTVPVVLNDYIPNVSTTSNINGKLLVADTSTSKWNAMAFSDVSGIPNPDSSNSGKLLGIGGDGWSLIDPSVATGLPMATAEGQIIVAKSIDGSVVWTTTLYTNSSPNTTTSYLIGGNNGVQLFTKSYLFEKSDSSVEISNGGNSYTYSVYNNADGLLFAHGILHYRFEVIVDPSATPNSNYTNIKINESTTISYSIPTYAAIVVVDGAYDLTTNTTLKSIAFNTDAMVCFKINSWYIEVIEAM